MDVGGCNRHKGSGKEIQRGPGPQPILFALAGCLERAEERHRGFRARPGPIVLIDLAPVASDLGGVHKRERLFPTIDRNFELRIASRLGWRRPSETYTAICSDFEDPAWRTRDQLEMEQLLHRADCHCGA